MKTITLAFCFAILTCGIAPASESQHAAIVDMPAVATLSHASPDTWDTLPPAQPNDWQIANADACAGPVLNPFAQQHRQGLGAELAF
jgi:hypothetical protein